jgi:hypothetical protein
MSKIQAVYTMQSYAAWPFKRCWIVSCKRFKRSDHEARVQFPSSDACSTTYILGAPIICMPMYNHTKYQWTTSLGLAAGLAGRMLSNNIHWTRNWCLLIRLSLLTPAEPEICMSTRLLSHVVQCYTTTQSATPQSQIIAMSCQELN